MRVMTPKFLTHQTRNWKLIPLVSMSFLPSFPSPSYFFFHLSSLPFLLWWAPPPSSFFGKTLPKWPQGE